MIKSSVTTSVKHKKPQVLYTRGWDLAYYVKDFWNEGHEVNGQVEKKKHANMWKQNPLWCKKQDELFRNKTTSIILVTIDQAFMVALEGQWVWLLAADKNNLVRLSSKRSPNWGMYRKVNA